MNLSSGIREVPAGSEHWPFVLDSFRGSLRTLAHVSCVSAHVAALEHTLRGGLGQTIVATPAGHPEVFLGWAAALHGALLFAYVPERLRRLGIARQMMADLFDSAPIRLVYWTDTATRLAEHGFPLVHDWQEFARRSRAAEWAARRQPNLLLIERTA